MALRLRNNLVCKASCLKPFSGPQSVVFIYQSWSLTLRLHQIWVITYEYRSLHIAMLNYLASQKPPSGVLTHFPSYFQNFVGSSPPPSLAIHCFVSRFCVVIVRVLYAWCRMGVTKILEAKSAPSCRLRSIWLPIDVYYMKWEAVQARPQY